MNDETLKTNLAAAYNILAMLQLDDHTYTHLSARPAGANYYYMYPFGLRFEEVTSNNLLKVSLDGELLESGSDADYTVNYNQTGYVIHGSIYKSRPEINAIFHLHTPEIVAVSAMKQGLMPISQWALHFYGKLSYHDYNSLALDSDTQGLKLAQDLGKNMVMLMRNHGSITCGQTIHEAMFYSYHLQQACKTQVLALSTGQELIIPPEDICMQANKDLLSFEKDLGKRDWDAWVRSYFKI